MNPLLNRPDEVESEAEVKSTADRASGPMRGWLFARQPFWVFSHFFALSVVVLFVFLGLWQLNRHDDRAAANIIITNRAAQQAVAVDGVDDVTADPSDLDFRLAVVSGEFVDPEFVHVVNRSQGGAAGEHVVALFVLDDGSTLAVNRGFVPTNADVELGVVGEGPTELRGWLRQTVEKGRFGVDDTGQGSKVPRFNINDLSNRLGRDLAPVWLQLDGNSSAQATFPDPVPLPPVDAGPHLSYAVQWFIFATLGVLFYGAMLRRQARTRQQA